MHTNQISPDRLRLCLVGFRCSHRETILARIESDPCSVTHIRMGSVRFEPTQTRVVVEWGGGGGGAGEGGGLASGGGDWDNSSRNVTI